MNVSTTSSTIISSNINPIPKTIIDVTNPIQDSTYFDFAGMDTGVSPADDFYNYASGTWMKNTEIPNDSSTWGTFPLIRRKVTNDLFEIIKTLDDSKSHEESLCKALYESAMNVQIQNDAGLQPLQTILDKIDKAECINSFIEVLADMLKLGLNAFCSWNVGTDPCDNKFIMIHLSDGGVALPNFQMYLKEKDTVSNKHEEKREKYKLFIDNLFQMAKIDLENPSAIVMKIETTLAAMFLSKVDGSNPDKTTNIQTPTGLWKQIFECWAVTDLTTSINVKNVKLLKTIEDLLENEILSDLKIYLKFTVLKRFSPMLGESFSNLYFDFFSKELLETKEQKPLKIRMCEMLNNNLASALGKIYVEKHFPASKKE